jgi:phosphoserine phosphatase
VSGVRSVVLDVDSTLCGIEGVDWLASLRGGTVLREVAALTDRAMRGEISLDSVYSERLARIQPTRAEIDALAVQYRETLAEGAHETIAELRARQVRVVAVSGGLLPAITPLAKELGVELHAVHVRFDTEGWYVGFDTASPLATQTGKLAIVRSLDLPRPAMAVGDGATDLAMRSAVDVFVAYTGFVRRPQVVSAADAACSSFAELLRLAEEWSA